METRYTIFSASVLPGGQVTLAGFFDGEPLSLGFRGYCASPDGAIEILVVGNCVSDPVLVKETKRQGVLVEVIQGAVSQLEGLTLKFQQ
jgi:hypothetical protein